MEEAIINWLIATVEADDRQREHVADVLNRTDGKRIVEVECHGDRERTFDYLTGELIEDDPQWDEWITPIGIDAEAYEAHPYPPVPAELVGILNEDLEPGVARAWVNKNVMPL